MVLIIKNSWSVIALSLVDGNVFFHHLFSVRMWHSRLKVFKYTHSFRNGILDIYFHNMPCPFLINSFFYLFDSNYQDFWGKIVIISRCLFHGFWILLVEWLKSKFRESRLLWYLTHIWGEKNDFPHKIFMKVNAIASAILFSVLITVRERAHTILIFFLWQCSFLHLLQNKDAVLCIVCTPERKMRLYEHLSPFLQVIQKWRTIFLEM